MNNASYQLPSYDLALRSWTRTRAACKGEESVKAIDQILPYLNSADTSSQNLERNLKYLQRAVYFNATGRTLEGLIGLAFAHDPQVNFGPFSYLKDDASGDGVSIYHMGQQGLAGVLQTGRHGFLSDIVNDKPTVVGYDAESIINWRVDSVAGVRKLVLLVLKENLDESDGDYATKQINQYREFRLVNNEVIVRVWRGDSKEVKLYTSSVLNIPHNLKKLDQIPFSFCGSVDNSSKIQPAPLSGLAEMNFAHFRDSADYQDSVFYCGQVQPWITGLSEEWRDALETNGLYIGSRRPILLPAGGMFGFAQAQPNTLAKEAMDNKERLMVALGARVVEQSVITKTATQAAGDIATNTSVLGLCTSNVSEAMTRAISLLGLYKDANLFKDAQFLITRDFTDQVMDANKVAALVAAWQAGAFASMDLRAYLKRMGVISPEREDSMIQEEVDNEVNFHSPSPPLDNTPAPIATGNDNA